MIFFFPSRTRRNYFPVCRQVFGVAGRTQVALTQSFCDPAEVGRRCCLSCQGRHSPLYCPRLPAKGVRIFLIPCQGRHSPCTGGRTSLAREWESYKLHGGSIAKRIENTRMRREMQQKKWMRGNVRQMERSPHLPAKSVFILPARAVVGWKRTLKCRRKRI